MVTQKPISVKIDYQLLDELDKEVELGHRKRNAHINEAIRCYLDMRDTARRYRAYITQKDRDKVLNEFKSRWMFRR